jgi:hypothetical protein
MIVDERLRQEIERLRPAERAALNRRINHGIDSPEAKAALREMRLRLKWIARSKSKEIEMPETKGQRQQ